MSETKNPHRFVEGNCIKCGKPCNREDLDASYSRFITECPGIEPPLPTLGSRWTHYNGATCTVLHIANVLDNNLYSRMIVYQSENGHVWAIMADDWHRSMTVILEPGYYWVRDRGNSKLVIREWDNGLWFAAGVSGGFKPDMIEVCSSRLKEPK